MAVEKKWKSIIKSSAGVTLVELLIAIAIFAVVVSGIWTNFLSQKRVYHAQQQTAMIQQNIRAAMFVMEKEFRMAGYDPSSKGYGITSIDGNTVAFTYDDNNGGASSRVYRLNGSDLETIIDGAADASLLAENIYNEGGKTGFTIAYAYDNNGDKRLDTVNGNIIWAIDTDNDDELDLRLDTNNDGSIDQIDDTDFDDVIDGVALDPKIPMSAIKAVKIWVLVQSDEPDPSYHEAETYVIGRNIIKTDDRIRRRMLSSIIKCRNL